MFKRKENEKINILREEVYRLQSHYLQALQKKQEENIRILGLEGRWAEVTHKEAIEQIMKHLGLKFRSQNPIRLEVTNVKTT